MKPPTLNDLTKAELIGLLEKVDRFFPPVNFENQITWILYKRFAEKARLLDDEAFAEWDDVNKMKPGFAQRRRQLDVDEKLERARRLHKKADSYWALHISGTGKEGKLNSQSVVQDKTKDQPKEENLDS